MSWFKAGPWTWGLRGSPGLHPQPCLAEVCFTGMVSILTVQAYHGSDGAITSPATLSSRVCRRLRHGVR